MIRHDFRAIGSAADLAHAEGRLRHSIASALSAIAAVRAEREMPPVDAARQSLRDVYGATRLRRRLERDAG